MNLETLETTTAGDGSPLALPKNLTSLPDGVRSGVDVVGDGACDALTGRLLAALTGARQPRGIVEVGSAEGLTAAWMASAVGRTVITTVEPDAAAADRARLVHESAGLPGIVRLLHSAAADELLDRLSDAQYELAVIQTDPAPGILAEIRRLLVPGGTLIVRRADVWFAHSAELARLLDSPNQTVVHLPINEGLVIATLK